MLSQKCLLSKVVLHINAYIDDTIILILQTMMITVIINE